MLYPHHLSLLYKDIIPNINNKVNKNMAEKFIVKEDDKLLNFLFATLHNWSKKKVKERLKSATVAVNGEGTTKFDFPLVVGDIVEVGVASKKISKLVTSLEIIYQDSELIAIDKPAGLLSVGTAKEKQNHALAILRKQISNRRNSIDIFPVHRLDRETSGVLLFATSKESREAVMAKWGKSEKVYLAVVDGCLKEQIGTINQPLRMDDKEYKVHAGEHPKAKFALTHYKVKETLAKTSLVQLRIETGRQHQIRVHMAWLGHYILGDERYGKGYKKGDRMGLHATKLTVIHPKSKKTLTFEVNAPKDFYALVE
jgi:23S rRNA pseudouridine1911/1915/1917 synthase